MPSTRCAAVGEPQRQLAPHARSRAARARSTGSESTRSTCVAGAVRGARVEAERRGERHRHRAHARGARPRPRRRAASTRAGGARGCRSRARPRPPAAADGRRGRALREPRGGHRAGTAAPPRGATSSSRSASQRAATASPPSALASAHSSRPAPRDLGPRERLRVHHAHVGVARRRQRVDELLPERPERRVERRARDRPAGRARACRPRRAAAAPRRAPSSPPGARARPSRAAGSRRGSRSRSGPRPRAAPCRSASSRCRRCRRAPRPAPRGPWPCGSRARAPCRGRRAGSTGRSGSSRAFWMRSSSRFAKPRSVSAPSAAASRASATTFSRFAICASPRREPVSAARMRVSS